MNDTTKSATKNAGATGYLYRATYTYAAPNGALRTGAVLIEAKDSKEAWEAAEKRIAAIGQLHSKITNVKLY